MEELNRRKVREAGEISSSHDQSVIVTEETQEVSFQRNPLEEKFATIREAGKNARNYISPTPKIQKVTFLRRYDMNFEMYYEPRLLSLGPIHHGKAKYKLGEKHKIVMTSAFIEDSGKDIKDLYREIEKKINYLRYCFEEEVTKKYDDETLAWLLFVDGCAILQYIYCAMKGNLNELNIKNDSAAFVHQDFFLLENQLPYCLLKLLMRLSRMKDELKLSIEMYIASHDMVPDNRKLKQAKDKEEVSPHSISMEEDPVHLLDLLRTCILGKPKTNFHKFPTDQDWQSYRNVQELKAAGILLGRSSNSYLSNVSFSSQQFHLLGHLYLPPILVDELTKPKFLNLIAYEMCPDFKNDFGVTSYIYFLDSLISDAKDVKELRKAGILYNFLGSDEEVAKLFNEIGTKLVPDPETYLDVRITIANHYHTLWSWMFRFYNDHFGGTWSIAGFLGVVLGLVLSGIQAWFTVNQASQSPASS